MNPDSAPQFSHHVVVALPAHRRRTLLPLSLALSVALLLLVSTLFPLLADDSPSAFSPDATSNTYTVRSLDDGFATPPPYSCGATCTLREALATAGENAGPDTIVFASGLEGVITLVGPLPVNSEVTIVGPGADKLTIAIPGNDFNNFRVLNVTNNVTLRGVTIARTGTGRGGGISNTRALILEEVVIIDTRYNGSGGGILNQGENAAVVMISSTISNSTGLRGGGILNVGGAVTVTNSLLQGNNTTGVVGEGTAIRNEGGTVFIADSTISNNTKQALANTNDGVFTVERATLSDNATALYNSGAGSTFAVTDSTIRNNRSSAIINGGGGVSEPGGYFTVTNTLIADNRASSAAAISNQQEGNFLLVESIVRGNVATFGGGAAIVNTLGGNFTVRKSTITENKVIDIATKGGAIANKSQGVFVLEESTVSNNRADGLESGITNRTEACGAIQNDGAGSTVDNPTHMTIRNSTISGNVAVRYGGAICVESLGAQGTSVVNILYSTIANNRITGPAENDGGGGIHVRGGGAALTMMGVILAENERNGGVADNLHIYPSNPGLFTSQGYNLSDTAVAGFGANDLPNTDAGLAPLADYGGPTWTHGLYKGSAAIDAASNAGCPANDQRGIVRPQDGDGTGGAVCDIGAYEADSELEPEETGQRLFVPFVAK